MPTDFLKDRVMTNTCFKKIEISHVEEGQIYYVRNELYSKNACFKHEHLIRENGFEASLSQKEAITKYGLISTNFRILHHQTRHKRHLLGDALYCQIFFNFYFYSLPCFFLRFFYFPLVCSTPTYHTDLQMTPTGYCFS